MHYLMPATLHEKQSRNKEDVMKKLNATLSLLTIALMSLFFSGATLAQQAPGYFAGNWTMYVTGTIDGQVNVRHVQISQYGNQIFGYFEGEYQAGPINGEVTGNRIHFITATRNPLNFHGEIFGNTITGQYIFHGNHAPWQAVRSVGIGLAPQAVVSYAQPQVTTVTTYSTPQTGYTPQASYTPPTNYNPQPGYTPPANYAPQTNSAPQPNYPPQNASYAQPANGDTQSSSYSAPTPAPLSADQLDALVAPIALYPDALVAQALAASTEPDEVTAANQWLSQNSNLTGQSLEQAVDQQDWDPSVKALTQFPSVLSNMASNLSWTSSLGQAFHYQQSDVMTAVQAMRAKAQAAGTLQSSTQITVTTPSPNTIVIQPANPQVVYVPQYNPAIIYGAPIVVPMYTPPVVYAAPVLGFGVGVAFGGGGWAVGGGFGWGFHAWACNWGGWGGGGGGNTIIFNHNTYINNNTWHTTNYNGYHPWGPGSNGRPYNPTTNPNGYRPGTDTHYGPNGAYHPNGYYGPNGAFHHDVPGTNPADQPNGGNNGNHGLIGGNGGVEHAGGATGSENHAWYGNNGTYHPDGNYKPGDDTHYGPNGAYHPNGYFGPDGGWHQDKPGTNPSSQPNGGHNGDHGLIGGNGGVQNPNAGKNGPGVAPAGGYHNDNRTQARNDNRPNPASSRMSGDGRANRAESTRGRTSMARQRPQEHHEVRQHAPVEHHSSGGGGRRR
jgi:Protein of unknown function (DUF3300)